MYNDVQSARQKLHDGAYTCVVLIGVEEYNSCERGVKPLLTLLQSGRDLRGAVAADKTVGAGAAHLYVLLGIRSLWANVISESALQILADNRIEVFYGECVPHIINRRGDGICPIEMAVAGAQSSEEALKLIVDALARLQKKQKAEEFKTATVGLFKALADENRLEIIEMLKNGEKCGCELLSALNIGQSTLSHHMHLLCDAGLVVARREGKWMYYSLSPDKMAAFEAIMEGCKLLSKSDN